MKKIVKITEKYPEREAPKTYPKATPFPYTWLNGLSLVLGLWFLLSPQPYRLLLSLLLLLPPIGILANRWRGGGLASLISTERDEEGDPRFSVAAFLSGPPIFVLVRVYLDYQFVHPFGLILPGLLTAGLLALLLLATQRGIPPNHPRRFGLYLFLFIPVLLYGYALALSVNSAYDYSSPIPYSTQVIEKHEQADHRKHRLRYAITIAPWAYRSEPEKIYVTKNRFEAVAVGEPITIQVKRGLLRMPWYYLDHP